MLQHAYLCAVPRGSLQCLFPLIPTPFRVICLPYSHPHFLPHSHPHISHSHAHLPTLTLTFSLPSSPPYSHHHLLPTLIITVSPLSPSPPQLSPPPPPSQSPCDLVLLQCWSDEEDETVKMGVFHIITISSFGTVQYIRMCTCLQSRMC